MKINQINTIIFFFSCAVLFSCKKENTTTSTTTNSLVSCCGILPDLGQFVTLFNAPRDGELGITNTKGIGMKPTDDISFETCLIEGAFFQSAETVVRKDIGTVTIGDLSIASSSTTRYQTKLDKMAEVKAMFDKEIPIDLGNQIQLSGTLRTPKELFVAQFSTIDTKKRLNIAQNIPFRWNEDTQNKDGLYIIIRFDPKSGANSDLANTPAVTKFFQTEDDGAYDLDATELKDIPSGARISIFVGRASYLNLKKDAKSYLVYAYSVCTDLVLVNK